VVDRKELYEAGQCIEFARSERKLAMSAAEKKRKVMRRFRMKSYACKGVVVRTIRNSIESDPLFLKAYEEALEILASGSKPDPIDMSSVSDEDKTAVKEFVDGIGEVLFKSPSLPKAAEKDPKRERP
jgi:hypothetical protein